MEPRRFEGVTRDQHGQLLDQRPADQQPVERVAVQLRQPLQGEQVIVSDVQAVEAEIADRVVQLGRSDPACGWRP